MTVEDEPINPGETTPTDVNAVDTAVTAVQEVVNIQDPSAVVEFVINGNFKKFDKWQLANMAVDVVEILVPVPLQPIFNVARQLLKNAQALEQLDVAAGDLSDRVVKLLRVVGNLHRKNAELLQDVVVDLQNTLWAIEVYLEKQLQLSKPKGIKRYISSCYAVQFKLDKVEAYNQKLDGHIKELETRLSVDTNNLVSETRDTALQIRDRQAILWISENAVELLNQEPIDEFGNAKFFKAQYRSRDAVVKMIITDNSDDQQIVLEEATVLVNVRDKNIARLVAACREAERAFLVFEFAGDSVISVLNDRDKCDLATRLGFIYGMASGMRYLHRQRDGIAHGNLCARNLLFNPKRNVVVITNIGIPDKMSAISYDNAAATWPDPNVDQEGEADPLPQDVYAFGMTCLELLLHPACTDVQLANVRDSIIADKLHPSLSLAGLDNLVQAIKPAFSKPASRPKMHMITEAVQAAIKDIESTIASAKSLGVSSLPNNDIVKVGNKAKKTKSSPDAAMPKPVRDVSLSTAGITAPFVTDLVRFAKHNGMELRSADSRFVLIEANNLVELRFVEQNIMGTLDVNPDWSTLRRLVLDDNQITGVIPAAVYDLVHLTELSLCNNQLVGPLSESISNLSRLQKLLLNGNELSGPLPHTISHLLDLQVLSLHHNAFSGRIPKELGLLEDLRYLTLNDNAFKDEIPNELGSLESLLTLHLHGNLLKGPIPAGFALMKHLEDLNLANNQLSGDIPVELGRLVNLKRLDLSKNALSACHLKFIGDLSSLEELNLSDNKIDTQLPKAIGKLTKLRRLNLAENKLSGPIPEVIENLVQLENLDLHKNDLSGMMPAGFGALKKLAFLQLQRNKLHGTIPDSIGNLTKLIRLDLSSNDLVSPIPSSIENLTSLRVLNLNGNRLIGDSIPEEFGKLKNLVEINVNSKDSTSKDAKQAVWMPKSQRTIPSNIDGMASLVRLRMKGAGIGVIPEAVCRLQHLQIMMLPLNPITELPTNIGDLKHLRILNIEGHRLKELPPSFTQLVNLEVLNLKVVRKNKDNVNGISLRCLPDDFGNLRNLKEVDLDSNSALAGRLPASFGQLNRLEHLKIYNIGLDEIPESLCRLSNLRILNLGKNPIQEIRDDFAKLAHLTTLTLVDTPVSKKLEEMAKLDKLPGLLNVFPKGIYKPIMPKAMPMQAVAIRSVVLEKEQ